MIYIEPWGGLCNRMTAIWAAYALSKELKQKMTIVWRCDFEMTIPMEYLFSVEGISVIVVYQKPKSILNYFKNWLSNKYWSIKAKQCDIHFESDVLSSKDSNHSVLKRVEN